LLGTITVIIP